MKLSYDRIVQDSEDTGLPLKDIINVSDEMMEYMYGEAYLLHQNKRYLEASVAFSMLSRLDKTNTKYLSGLASSYLQLEEYESAAMIYQICSLIEPNNPYYPFHASNCYTKLEDYEKTADCLEACMEIGLKNEEYADFYTKAKELLETLIQKLEE